MPHEQPWLDAQTKEIVDVKIDIPKKKYNVFLLQKIHSIALKEAREETMSIYSEARVFTHDGVEGSVESMIFFKNAYTKHYEKLIKDLDTEMNKLPEPQIACNHKTCLSVDNVNSYDTKLYVDHCQTCIYNKDKQ